MIVCFDIGGTTIKGAYARSPETLEPLERVPTPTRDFEAFVDAIRKTVNAASERPTGLALSIAAIVDPDTRGMIVANIPCINGRDLERELAASLRLPVVIANDADCFALAEATFGVGRGHEVVFGTILGSGVGGGLVVRGELVNEGGGYAGEWGHGPISAQIAGTPPRAIPRFNCGCGQVGCIDSICSARGLERLDHHLHGRELTSVDIIASWEAGDPRSAETIDVHVDLLASPLAVLVNVTGASIVPVGGGLSNARGLIAKLDEVTRSRTLRRFTTPLVVPAELTIEPGLIGSAILGFRRLHPAAAA